MASVIQICNIALSNIRAGSINSLTEGSLASQLCSLKYDILRDQTISDAPWQFANRVEPLAPLSDESFNAYNWVYSYQYPSGCLHINRLMLDIEEANQDNLGLVSRYRDPSLPIINFNQQVKYKIQLLNGKKVITSNEADLRVDYRSRVADPNFYDAQFVLALSYLLASELAVPLIGADTGRGLKKDALSIYDAYINAAIANNANEQYSPPSDSEFVTVRG